MDFSDKLKLVLGNAKFWTALWAFAQVIILYVAPEFPKELLLAATAFFGVVAGLFFASDVGEQRAQLKARDERAAAALNAWIEDEKTIKN